MPMARSELPDDMGIAPELAEDLEIVEIDIPEGEDDDYAGLYEMGEDGALSLIEEDGDAEEPDWDDNLAEFVDEKVLDRLGQDLVQHYRQDRLDRKDWEDTYKDGLKLLGIKLEQRTMPWQNACGAFHPILAEAVVRYVSEAIMEAFPPSGPADTSIIGKDTPEILKRARRVKDEMNYQCVYKMPEFRPELEMTFFRQAIAGSCFRKVFYDPILRRPTARMAPAEDLVVCYGTSDLLTCQRYTHVERVSTNEIKKLQRIKFYRKVDLQDVSPEAEEINDEIDELQGIELSNMEDAKRTRLEMYVNLDLAGFEDIDEDGEETGIELPYIVTVDLDSNKILGIRRNHTEANPYVKESTYFSEYHYIRGFGFYGLGLIHLLGGIADTSTSILRQLVDAGTLSNIPAGYKGKGLRVKDQSEPLSPGELRDVDVLAGTLKDQIVWMPQKEPSMVLFQLLGSLVDEGRRVGSVADMKIADSAQNSPVGTTLALIERVMRVMSAVQARNNVALGSELKMLAEIIKEQMGPQYDYPVDGEYSREQDFGPPINILPVADPSATTISQRLIRMRAAIELAREQPQYFDMPRLYRDTFEMMSIKNADKVVPIKDDFVPTDPVSENMNIIMLRPVKAFLHQDHEAHLSVHMAALQDPLIMQVIGQSPNAAAIQASMMAHVQEHVAFAYRARMEKMSGFAMPDPDNPVPPEMEVSMSPLIAAAAQKVLQQSQAEAAQQQQQAQAQDPMLQIEQTKLRVKELEITLRAKEAEAKNALDEKKLMIMKEIEDTKAEIAQAEILIKNHQLENQELTKRMNAKEDRESRERTDGVRIGTDLVKHREKLKSDKEKPNAPRTSRGTARKKPKAGS